MTPETPPASLLLATDLGAGCDRALARAVQLARQWQARLVVCCVLPPGGDLRGEILGRPGWPNARQPADWARRQLDRLLGDQADGLDLVLRVEEGETGPVLLQVATGEGCGLVVTGHGGDPLAGEDAAPAPTVAWLARQSPVPLLVVRQPVQGPYRSMALATDFSAPSARALERALALFGEPVQLVLLHALEIPRAVLRDTPQDTLEDEAARQAKAQARRFLAEGPWTAAVVRQARVVVEPGSPARIAAHYVRDHDTGLLVVGSHGRRPLSELLLGSQARRLLAAGGTDTLLVRPAG